MRPYPIRPCSLLLQCPEDDHTCPEPDCMKCVDPKEECVPAPLKIESNAGECGLSGVCQKDEVTKLYTGECVVSGCRSVLPTVSLT